MYRSLIIGSLALGLGAGSAAAQAPSSPAPKVFLEGRGGVVIPTFDIADVATSGAAFGATLGFRPDARWVLMAEFDYGAHEDDPTETVDIKTSHYLGKVGFTLTRPAERGWDVILNFGAGAVTFDVDGAPEKRTYFAINAGLKIAYQFNRSFALVLSPQGDIAFGDESEIGTSNAWVWPVTAGLRVSF